jgi:hypothetical protein
LHQLKWSHDQKAVFKDQETVSSSRTNVRELETFVLLAKLEGGSPPRAPTGHNCLAGSFYWDFGAPRTVRCHVIVEGFAEFTELLADL